MTDYTMVGLTKKRAWVAGEIENTHGKLRQLIADLEAIDATLKVFDPNIQVEAIKPKAFRPPADWAHRGEMSRVVLTILRLASEPLTTRDVAYQLLIERALDKHDAKLLRLMSKRVGVALRCQRDAGRVKSITGPGQFNLWEVRR